ncbi:hypothetical protein O4H49_04605 [Kiloniella laminariae]|uniref:Uncharacterized protein n=1 Tax=Kiloniella laminariae TaxID=454162 RepID=A0ABT4LG13_9PROT|nr:hypothetical protein [Kiloniella laminariae]MCZ4280046.1 hypothetical protein [Kiloniella laminariae]
MEDLFTVITALDNEEITRDKAHKKMASWGKTTLKKHLDAAGLGGEKLPPHPETLAKILLSLTRPDPENRRLITPKTLEAIVTGKLFDDDPPDLKQRFALRQGNKVKVMVLRDRPGQPPRLEQDFELAGADLPAEIMTEIPEAPEDPDLSTPPEDPDIPHGTIETVARSYYRVDIKLVYWIPYRPNKFPIPTRFLPTRWKFATMSQEQRMAARAMLATGNPPPPRTFPTKASWDKLVASKEYRGVTHHLLFVCCPGERPKNDLDYLNKAGYTPAPSEVPATPANTLAKRLNDDHKDQQTVGSIAESLLNSDTGTEITGVPGFAVGDQYEDAAALIKELCDETNESFSEGERHYKYTPAADCFSGNWDFAVRVGKAHNLLNYAATGKLIAFQGGDLGFKLCCSDGKLKLHYKYSAIPSQALYINNRRVWKHDMLSADWEKVEECFYTPTRYATWGSKAELKAALESKKMSPRPFTKDVEFPLVSTTGCPTPIPETWIYDRDI